MTPAESCLDCDAVIVNYNAGKLLADCVRSVFAAGASLVIVVDNASTDESLTFLEQALRNDKLLIIRNDKNLGFAAACNIGIRKSSAKSVLFINPDCILAPDALLLMVGVLESSKTIGLVGGRLCNPDGTEQAGGRRNFPTPRRAFMHALGLSWLAEIFPKSFPSYLLHKQPLPSRPVEIEAISGACMLASREAINNVGGWDEGYFLHCEDLDWCMRFHQNNWKIIFVPTAEVIHLGGACSRNREIFVEWHKHQGMVRFYRKFFYPKRLGVLGMVVIIGVWLRFMLIAGYYSIRSVLFR